MAVGLPGQAGAYATLVGECMATFRPSYLPRESAHGFLSLQGGGLSAALSSAVVDAEFTWVPARAALVKVLH